MRFAAAALRDARRAARSAIHVSLERNMKCAIGPLRPLPARAAVRLPGRPGLPLRPRRAAARGRGSCELARRKPKLAVWKFASCDGCQLSAARLRGRAAALAGEVEIAHFLEATPRRRSTGPTTSRSSRARSPRPTTPSASARSARQSRLLVTIGACATAGGIQALRNFADVEDFIVGRLRDARVHLDARAPRRRSPRTCTVDFELRGCPIDKRQLLEVISAFLARPPARVADAQRLHRVQARAATSA